MRTLTCILFALPATWAAQNLTTTLTGVGTVSFSGAAITPTTPMRLEYAYDSFSIAASDSARFIGVGTSAFLNLFGCRMSGTVLQCIDDLDSAGNGFPSIDLANWDAAHGDYGFSVRFERNPTQGYISLTVCRMDGSNCNSDTRTQGSWGSTTIAGANIGRAGWGAGNNSIYGKLALFRFSTTLAGTTRPPNAHNAPAANVVDWEFEGSLTDSVRSATWSLDWGSAGYTTTIARMPVCNAGTTQTFRAGQPVTLDGSGSFALDGNTTLNEIWQQTAGPVPLVWSSHTAITPSLNGSVFGTYTFSEVVSDASGGRSAPCAITHSATATDANGVVLVPNASHAPFIANLTRFGVDPWPYYDQQQQKFLDWLVTNINTFYLNYWDTPATGTITVSDGGTQIIGSGTHFQADVCGGAGNTTPVLDPHVIAQIVVWYPYQGSSPYAGKAGRLEIPVWRCTSDTVLEMGRNSGDGALNTWHNTDWIGSGSGLGYTIINSGNSQVSSYWHFGPRPLNYYDQVLALYAMYYRTGNVKYLNTARTLADRFWTYPQMDRGSTYDGNHGYWNFPSRSRSLSGIILRAIDSPSEDMKPGLRRFADYAQTFDMPNAADAFDFREGGYALKWVSEIGIIDSSYRSSAVTKVLDMLTNKWTPQRLSDGHWNTRETYDVSGMLSSALGGGLAGTAHVVNGSPTVTGTSTAWDTAFWCATTGHYVVFYPTSATSYTTAAGDNTGETVSYKITATTATTMTISPAYSGADGNRYFGCTDSTVGMGFQPYMLGITSQAMMRSADLLAVADSTAYASQISLYRSYAADISNALRARRSADGGIFYSINPGCNNPSPDPTYCDNGPEGNRLNYAEAQFANVLEYAVNPSGALATDNDSIWSMQFGKPGSGAIVEDSRYIWQLENYMYTANDPNTTGKWLGFYFGIGRLAEWTGARLGGLASAQARTMKVTARIADHPLAAKFQVTVVDPQGVAAAPVVCTSSPCAITTPDARQGAHLYKIDLLNSSNAVVLAGGYVPLTVQ
jgi:hypothetical protein